MAELADRFAHEQASPRERDIRAVCELADRPEFVSRYLASDKSTSQILQELVRIRLLDQLDYCSAGASPN